MSEFKLRRLGMLMEPEPGNPLEVEGVLNPAAVRGPDRELYLFPRLVAKGNYSRIGVARVRFNESGDPVGVERLGIALEPEAEYERRPMAAVVVRIPALRSWNRSNATSCLTRHFRLRAKDRPGPIGGPLHWERLGLTTYAHWHGIELGNVDDKDASLFPVAILTPPGN